MSVTETEKPKPQLNVKLIVPFVNSVRNLFSTMIGIQATVQRPSVKAVPVPTYDVSAIIGFSGEILGSVVVSFPKATAVGIVKAFTGMEMTADSPDFADAVG